MNLKNYFHNTNYNNNLYNHLMIMKQQKVMKLFSNQYIEVEKHLLMILLK